MIAFFELNTFLMWFKASALLVQEPPLGGLRVLECWVSKCEVGRETQHYLGLSGTSFR